MNKKIIFITIFILFITAGCYNIKYYGTKLNKEEKKINNEKIKYLKNKFSDANIIFDGREDGVTSCRCDKEFFDSTCLTYKCNKVEGKYKWRYKVCSKKAETVCINADYDEVKEKWVISHPQRFKYIQNVVNELEKNNIMYYPYESKEEANFIITIKKPKNDKKLKKAITSIYNNYKANSNNQSPFKSEIVILDEDDFNYLMKNYDDSKKVEGSKTLYGFLASSDTDIDGVNIANNVINEDMFECSPNNYQHISYKLNTNTSDIWEIVCVGF